MAKLTRKVWVGIGAATIAGVSVGAHVAAQQPHDGHKGHDAGKAPAASATATPAEGGEAYLTDGGPKDTRIRFYRDIELMRGHLLIGQQLIELGLWDEALPHFLHPTEELYGVMEKYIKAHNIPPFRRELQALAQAVKAKRQGAYEQALKVVDRRLGAALDTVKRFMTPLPSYSARTAAEILKVALGEYEASIENGRFVKPVEYQDSRGFVLRAEYLIETAAPELVKRDAAAVAKVREAIAKLKVAWPTPMPPGSPALDVGSMSALVSDIELHVSRF